MSSYSFRNGMPTWNGVPMVGGFPMGLTECYFVDYGNGNDGVSKKSNSVSRPFKTIAKAEGLITTNKNEGIALMGNSTHALTEMLTVDKNRMHIFGYDPGTRMYGQNAKVSLGVTTAATDIGTLKDTGVRNTYTNIKFINNNTVAQGVYCVVDGGEYAQYANCEFYKSTDLDVTGASELVANGDSSSFFNCTIGSSANAISGAIIRANVLFTKALAGTGKVARDNYFENCILWRRSSNVANRFVYGANATDIERFCIFKGCLFANAKNAAAVPAQNVAFGSSLTVGEVLLWNCSSMNAATAMSTTTGVFVDSPVPTAGTSGISVQAT